MYIGIDLGTSGVKLILVDSSGKVIRSVSKEYELLIPKPSWAEQDPYVWFDMTMEGLKKLILDYENSIRGISFSGQMHGLVILDDNDRVLRNALLWNDQRTVKEVEYLNNEIGVKNLLEYTGNIALTGLTAPKILWVRNNEPEIFSKISKIMLPKDYIAYKLTGVFASDVSDTSGTLYYDVKNKRYSKEMLDILGISEDQLPKVYESYELIGKLKENIKHELKISSDISVVIGGGDQAVGAVGVGIVNDGEASISLGTSGVIFVSSNTFNIDHKSYLQSYAHCNGKYHVMAVMLNAASALKWWHEKVFDENNYTEFFENLSKTSIDDNLFFLPYLSGERSPINDPNAKGVFFGLGLQHRKEHMNRSVIEGVSFALKDSFELIKNLGIDITTLRITGGGAKSKVWAQMIADIFNVNVVTIKVEEGPALGAAILAMVGTGLFNSIEEACSTIVELNETFVPNLSVVEIYKNKYFKFKKLYPQMRSIFLFD